MKAYAVVHADLVREARLVLAGQIATAVVGLAAIRVITEVLSPEAYGLATLFLVTLSLAKGLFLAPILAGQLRYDQRAEAQGTGLNLYLAAGRLFAFGLVVAVVASIGVILVFRLKAPGTGLATLALVFASWLAADATIAACFNALNARRLQGKLSLLRLADSLARPAAAVSIVLLLWPGAPGYVAGRAIGAALVLICTGAIAVKHVRWFGLSWKVNRAGATHEWRVRLIRYGWPLIPVSVLNWTIHLADRLILNAFHDSAAVGVYAASYGLASQPFIMLSAALTLLMRPHMFEAADRRRDSLGYLRGRWLMWLTGLGSTGLLVLTVFRQQVGQLFLAPAYREDTWLLVIIGAAYLLLGYGQLAENSALAEEDTGRVLWVSGWSTAASLVAAVALIPKYAAYGAAWSTLIGLATYAALLWLPLKQEAT